MESEFKKRFSELNRFIDSHEHLYYTGIMNETDNIARYINNKGRMCAYLATGVDDDSCREYRNAIIRIHTMGHVRKAKNINGIGVIMNKDDYNYAKDKENCIKAGLDENNIFELISEEMMQLCSD